LLQVAIKRKWVIQDLDSRALGLTVTGQREMAARFGISPETEVKSTGAFAGRLAPTMDLR